MIQPVSTPFSIKRSPAINPMKQQYLITHAILWAAAIIAAAILQAPATLTAIILPVLAACALLIRPAPCRAESKGEITTSR